VKLIPRHSDILGRYVLERAPSVILRPDETKETTTIVLIDALGPDAEAAGLKVGDMILPNRVTNMKFYGGSSIRPSIEEKDVKYWATDVDKKRLVVQNENGTKYVDFDDPEAAKSLAAVVDQASNGRDRLAEASS